MTSALATIRRKLDNAIFGPETAARLVFLQGGIMVLFAARTIAVPYYKLTPQPSGLFEPVPIIEFLDRMPPRGVVFALEAIIVAAAIMWFVAGRKPWRANGRRIAFIVAWVGFLFLVALPASRGKTYHRDLLLLWGAVPMLFAPTDARATDRISSRRTGWPIRSSIAVLSVAYFCTGYQKLNATGLDWIFSDNLRWALYWGRVRGAPSPWQELAYFIADRPLLSTLSAAFIVGFELLFPLVLFFPRTRPVFVVAAWMFHGGTYLMIGLDYWFYAFVVTLVLLDWPAIIDRFRRTRAPAAVT